jgi:acetyltransferase
VLEEQHTADDGSTNETERIIGVSRYITNPDQTSCEFSLAVADDVSGHGIGTRLMLSIIESARDKGLSEIIGLILSNNVNMLKLMGKLGFAISAYPEDPDFKLATMAL